MNALSSKLKKKKNERGRDKREKEHDGENKGAPHSTKTGGMGDKHLIRPALPDFDALI